MHKIKEEALDKQITIDGNFVKSYNTITINQFLYKHHTFEVVVDIETVEEAGSYTLDKSKEWLGKQFTTNVSGKAFVGVVLDVSMRHSEIGLHGELILKGLSQTVLLENGKQQKSWLEKELGSIVSEIIGTTAIKNKVRPAYTRVIPYQCQYAESDYKYLQRLAYQYNEWFYFDGVDVVFGKPESEGQKPIELEYSKDLKELQIKAKTYNPTLATYSYDSLNDQFFENDLKANNEGLNDLGNTALKASEEVYKEVKDFGVSDVFLQDKSSLDEYLQKRLQGLSAGGNVLKASGIKKGLCLGSTIKVSAAKYDEGKYTIKQYGEYIITQISHFAGVGGAYYNTFEAIPANTKSLPLNENIAPAVANNQVAKVVSNKDPESKGRVQVQFYWQEAIGAKTDFIRVMTPDAGSSDLTKTNRGFVFIPEVGDQVMIGFEHNDPNRPFVMGSMFTGKNGAGGDNKNVRKSIITRSGHTIELDDTEKAESITITDKNKNIIFIDTAKNSIDITANETLNLNCKNMNINVAENMNTIVGSNISETAGQNIITSAGKDISQMAGADFVKKSINMSEEVDENMDVSAKMSQDVAGKLDIASTVESLNFNSAKSIASNSKEQSNFQ
ncbi:type VI secretion system Vgr family protein [Tenacibaculum sp. SDUM215027]|uniref:type VI secretion system Vgr family protein n=1 Tax=Tenacibaculum sp. SDUM215027 TaxID=3422596 RepID=UPI003D310D94